MRKVTLILVLALLLLATTVVPALAGSLIRGEESTIPSDGSGTLEKVCQSTSEDGDAVTNEVSDLQTFDSEDCS
ncbi:MAG: hypothetical protein IIA89_14540 [Chloroflexi bacterium]|nr:hypothetical protein [Chloroflexota bacterium]